MPVLHREAGFAFRFFASDGPEPPHVHVVGHGGLAKVWLVPEVKLAAVRRYDARRRSKIVKIAREHRVEWVEAWDRFFGHR